MTARIFLVGAGPGDPTLLTIKASKLLATADVVVLDALVSPQIKAMINSAAEIIHAGKRAGSHSLPQDEINALLVQLGASRRRVVRLKGGDPFVFGRGGEEAQALCQAGIAFEIVPGISSAIAGPAYAGIPVTHRNVATSFTVVTGHESDGSSGIDWPGLATIPGTVVLLMGLSQLETIAAKLIEHGKSADSRVAVISSATTSRQRTVTGTLGDISERVGEAALEAPALIVVGEVVKLRETIAWFEKRPLFGRTCVVTRARAQASVLSELLEDAGAIVIQFPLIEIAPASSFESLDRLIAEIETFDWLVFSSTNGVEYFHARLVDQKRDLRTLHRAKIAAVGSATADALRAFGLIADIVPDKFQSSALLPHLPASLDGTKIGVIRGRDGNEEFLEGLRSRGADVHLAIAYENRTSSESGEELRRLLSEGAIDVVTFTSGSTVENFFAALSKEDRESVRRVALASIGPVTSTAIRRHAFEPTLEATEATVESLVEAIVEYATVATGPRAIREDHDHPG